VGADNLSAPAFALGGRGTRLASKKQTYALRWLLTAPEKRNVCRTGGPAHRSNRQAFVVFGGLGRRDPRCHAADRSL